MSASSRPTRAPDSWRDAARFTATVDLPTPPLPEPTAITCLTPGIAGSRWPLKAGRTFAVISRSTAVTPGISATSCLARVWKRSRTGHAGVVSSKVKLTRPASSIARSLIMPRLTTSRPRSGSLIADRTDRTSSLLGTEDHRCPQRKHRHQHDDGHDGRLHRHWGRHGFTRRGHTRRTAKTEERRQHAGDGDDPERDPGKNAASPTRQGHCDEERDQERELEDREISVGDAKPRQGDGGFRAIADEERDQRRRAAQAGGEEQTAQRPGVTPDRLVADAEEHACVGRDEEPEQRADDGDQPS